MDSEKCEPAHDSSNFCGIFTGQLNVYGRDKEKATPYVFQLIEETLNPSDPTKLHPELVEMASAKQYVEVTGGDVDLDESSTREILGWVSLVFVGIIFFLSVWCCLIRGDKQMDSGSFSRSTNRNKRVWNRFYRRGQHQNTAYYQEEKSTGTHSEEEDGDGLLNNTLDGPAFSDGSSSVASIYHDEEVSATSHMI